MNVLYRDRDYKKYITKIK